MRLVRIGGRILNFDNLTCADLANDYVPDGSLRLYFLDSSWVDVHDEDADALRAWLHGHSVDVTLWSATPSKQTRQPACSPTKQDSTTDSVGLKQCATCTNLTFAENGVCRRCKTGDLRP